MENEKKEEKKEENLKEKVARMSEGNPGAINVMCQALGKDQFKGELILGILEHYKITGSKIWVMYKDENDQDIDKFCKAVIKKGTEIKI